MRAHQSKDRRGRGPEEGHRPRHFAALGAGLGPVSLAQAPPAAGGSGGVMLAVAVALGALLLVVAGYALRRALRAERARDDAERARDDAERARDDAERARDDAERARDHEAALRKAIVEGSPIGQLMVTSDGVIRDANPAASALLERPMAELVGVAMKDLLPPAKGGAPPEQRAGFTAPGEARPMGAARDIVARRRDGAEVVLELSLTPLDPGGGPATLASLVDVTEARRLAALERERAAALARANAELARSNDALAQLASAASEELRDPLDRVATHAQLLARRGRHLLDARDRALLGVITDEAERLRSLMDGVQLYADASARRGEPARVPMSDAGLEALALLLGAVEESGAAVEIAEGMPAVLADRAAMVQLWHGLLRNGIVHRGEAPPELRAGAREVEAGVATFYLTDNAPGIPPERQASVFSLFARADGERPDGASVDLAVCRQVVEQRGGRLWVESDGALGSTFCFTLPVADPP